LESGALIREPRRTRSVTFRIDPNVQSALDAEAKRTGINLNTLASQVFRRYVGWGQYADRLKLIPVSKDLLREVFQLANKEAVIEVAHRLAETSGREHILFLFQKANLTTVTRFLDIWRNHFDASEHRIEGRAHFYTLHHDVNLNFSQFIKEYVSTLIQNTIPRPVHFETVSPNSVTFNFEET